MKKNKLFRVDLYTNNMGNCIGFAKNIREARYLLKLEGNFQLSPVALEGDFGQITEFRYPVLLLNEHELELTNDSNTTIDDVINFIWSDENSEIVETSYYEPIN